MTKVSKKKIEPLRILQIGMHDKIGGVETFLINYYRNINRKKLQFDFINTYDSLCFENEIKELGGKIYNVPFFKKHPIKYYCTLKKIFKNYDIIHINMLSCANVLPVIIASRLKVKKIIVHSHNNGIPKGFLRMVLNRLNKKIILKNATDFFACSISAGKWMFGDKKFEVINNCIDINKFKYSDEFRHEIRKKYDLKKDMYVIGHVGRFDEQKNHEYIIDLFKMLHEKNSKFILMLIGDGLLRKKIEEKVNKYGLKEFVIFVGNTDFVEKYYSAMDLFILPSKFEGLGIVNVEAQASNLPCIVSDIVPIDVKLCDNFIYKNLNDLDGWISSIDFFYKLKNNDRKVYKNNNLNSYDLKSNIDKFEKIFM